jgi:DNA-binding HxlR family transcriptional regulator
MKKMKTLCPVERSLEIISGKWKICILWKLLSRTYRFGEFKKEMPDITIKMLVQQLKQLETSGLINRKDYKTIPPKVEYSISTFGRTLTAIISNIAKWGIKNEKHVNQALSKLNKNNYFI